MTLYIPEALLEDRCDDLLHLSEWKVWKQPPPQQSGQRSVNGRGPRGRAVGKGVEMLENGFVAVLGVEDGVLQRRATHWREVTAGEGTETRI
jgi:hypothetical protein